jgi:hypothetical protein
MWSVTEVTRALLVGFMRRKIIVNMGIMGTNEHSVDTVPVDIFDHGSMIHGVPKFNSEYLNWEQTESRQPQSSWQLKLAQATNFQPHWSMQLQIYAISRVRNGKLADCYCIYPWISTKILVLHPQFQDARVGSSLTADQMLLELWNSKVSATGPT